jgi:hypothetical protein
MLEGNLQIPVDFSIGRVRGKAASFGWSKDAKAIGRQCRTGILPREPVQQAKPVFASGEVGHEDPVDGSPSMHKRQNLVSQLKNAVDHFAPGAYYVLISWRDFTRVAPCSWNEIAICNGLAARPGVSPAANLSRPAQ